MLGAIFGDMVGSQFDFTGFKSMEFELFTDKFSFTDDSLMTLAIAKTLLVEGLDDVESLKNKTIYNMVDIYRKYPDTNWGFMFLGWLNGVKTPINSMGNGAAMRISPVGWVANSIDEVKLLSKYVTEISHNHPEGIKGAEAIAIAVYLARIGKSKEEIRDYIGNNYYEEVLNEDFESLQERYGRFDDLREDGEEWLYVTCPGSVPHAIRAFLASNSFIDAIRKAISLGGDSDTIGAMCGCIAEAYYGMTPYEELEVLKRLPDDLADICYAFETIKKKRIKKLEK